MLIATNDSMTGWARSGSHAINCGPMAVMKWMTTFYRRSLSSDYQSLNDF